MTAPVESWAAITTGQTDPDSPLDTTLMSALRTNQAHLREILYGVGVGTFKTPQIGHDHDGTNSVKVGAGSIGQTEVGNNAIGLGELKFSSFSGSLALGTSATGSVTLQGGAAGWWTGSGTNAFAGSGIIFGNGNTAAGVIGLHNTDSVSANTFYWDEGWVPASPPYDLGDGEIPLFIIVLLDSSGNIVGFAGGTDPSWAYNGPTNIVPDFRKDGKAYQKRIILPSELRNIPGKHSERAARLRDLQEFRKSAGKNDFEDIEVSQAIKNADMNIVPHNFYLNDLAGLTPVLLDPVSNLTHDLLLMHEDGENIRDLFLAGNFVIDNVELGRNKPDVLMSVGYRWKNTV